MWGLIEQVRELKATVGQVRALAYKWQLEAHDIAERSQWGSALLYLKSQELLKVLEGMPPEHGSSSVLTLPSPDSQLSCTCSNCRKGTIIKDSEDVTVNLIGVGRPEAVILTMDADAAFLYGAPRIMRTATGESYYRIHPTDHIVAPPVVTYKVGALVPYAFAAVSYYYKRCRLGDSNEG